MIFERENVVAVVISVIAVLFIVGGFASFSGLSTYSGLSLNLERATFARGDIFGAEVVVALDSVLSDETLILKLDGIPFKTIDFQDYVTASGLRHSLEEKGGLSVLRLGEPVKIHLSDFVTVDSLANGGHQIDASLSKGELTARGKFSVG